MDPKESPGSGKPLFLNEDEEEEIRDMIHGMDQSRFEVGNATDNPAEFVFENTIIRWSEVPIDMIDKVRGYLVKRDNAANLKAPKPVGRTDTVIPGQRNAHYSELNEIPDWDDDEIVPPPTSPQKPKKDSDLAGVEDTEEVGDDNSDLMMTVSTLGPVYNQPESDPLIAAQALPPTPAPAPMRTASKTPAPLDQDRITPRHSSPRQYRNGVWRAGSDDEVDESPTTGSRHRSSDPPVPPSLDMKTRSNGVTAVPVEKHGPDPLDKWFVGAPGGLAQLAHNPPIPVLDPGRQQEKPMTAVPTTPSKPKNKWLWIGLGLTAATACVIAIGFSLSALGAFGQKQPPTTETVAALDATQPSADPVASDTDPSVADVPDPTVIDQPIVDATSPNPPAVVEPTPPVPPPSKKERRAAKVREIADAIKRGEQVPQAGTDGFEDWSGMFREAETLAQSEMATASVIREELLVLEVPYLTAGNQTCVAGVLLTPGLTVAGKEHVALCGRGLTADGNTLMVKGSPITSEDMVSALSELTGVIEDTAVGGVIVYCQTSKGGFNNLPPCTRMTDK